MKKLAVILSLTMILTVVLMSGCLRAGNPTDVNHEAAIPASEQAAVPADRAPDKSSTTETAPAYEAPAESTPLPQNAAAISAASHHALALMEDGTLWAWGGAARDWWSEGSIGLIGDGTNEIRRRPVKIMEDVIYAVAGLHHSLAITSDRVLWAWGSNYWGQIGDGTTINRLSPVPIMEDVIFAAIPEDTLHSHIGGGTRSYAIQSDGSLWAWGENRLPDHWRQEPLLGDGTTIDRETPVKIMENVSSVITMGNAAYAITMDGTLWGWGNNGGALGSGIIGDGTIFSPEEFEKHIEYFSELWEGIGLRWLLDGDGGTGLRLSPVKIMENVASVVPIYSMFDHGWIRTFRTFALTKCGSVWAWGENDDFGQGWGLLGDGTTETRLSPVRIIEGRN